MEIPLQPMEKTMVYQAPGRNCVPWEVHTWAWEQCEEEGGVEEDYNGLTTIPLHHPFVVLRGREEVEETGVKEWGLGRGGWRKVALFGFVSHYPILVLIGNEFDQFSSSWVCFAHDGNW